MLDRADEIEANKPIRRENKRQYLLKYYREHNEAQLQRNRKYKTEKRAEYNAYMRELKRKRRIEKAQKAAESRMAQKEP